MADEALDRSCHGLDPVFGRQRTELGIVDGTRPRSGDLEGPNGPGRDPGLEACSPHRASRGFAHRGSRPHRHAPNYALDAISRGAGVGQALEHQHHRTLAGNPSASSGVEGGAGTIGEHALEREALVGHEVEVALAGSTEHGIALALTEEVDRRRQR